MIAALLETRAFVAIEQIPVVLREIRDALRDSQKPINALAPRNCDRFTDVSDAMRAFLNETDEIAIGPSGRRIFEWLLAKYKGEMK